MQHINLFHALPQKPRYDLPAVLLFQVLGGFFAFLLLIYACQSAYLYHLSGEEKKERAEAATAKAYLAKVQKDYPAQARNAGLQAEILKLKVNLEDKKEFLDELSKNSNRFQKKFTDYLVGLGNAVVPGLWLTRIVIMDYDQNVGFLGKTNDQRLIPIFLEKLRHQPVFQGRQFSNVGLEVDPNSGVVIFRIATDASMAALLQKTPPGVTNAPAQPGAKQGQTPVPVNASPELSSPPAMTKTPAAGSQPNTTEGAQTVSPSSETTTAPTSASSTPSSLPAPSTSPTSSATQDASPADKNTTVNAPPAAASPQVSLAP